MNVVRRRKAGLFGIGATVLALLLAFVGLPPWGDGGDGDGGPGVYGDPRPRSGSPSTELGWGFTHTQNSADEGKRGARDRAARLLSAARLPQNQHIMGWGADNPEPSPGQYDFEALDRRVAFMRKSGATPVITLCCAPDWMKSGGKAGSTDWSRLEEAPAPRHFADFAKLAGTVARRYPDVRHFIVWNEMKGFYDDTARRWDYEGYTRLYNLVYTELKKAGKDNLVGGPYVVMDSVGKASDNASRVRGPWGALDQRALDAVSYWSEHRKGADFAVVDGSSYTMDDRLLPDEFRATDKLTAVTRWVGRETGLPVWWAEWYVEVGDERDERDGWSEPHRVAVHAGALIALARGRTATAFYWNPQNSRAACAGCLWRNTRLADGGEPLPMMRLLTRFAREFPPGTRFERVRIAEDDAPNVRVLADDDAVLVVNTLARGIEAKIDGRTFDMAPYEVRWLKR
ncbi:xylan 1,4-beta-xylosidase [Streptomyces sp. SB3404]|uniref:Xylan 1,4-beta-xylosidase n=2 Tax=Streptomyces boncukensis TaxID=2711219 RepID=A0A6G4X6W4_9ACTN|nr:xylan 1,4-beta-xylosidase [Streptomyces boncukensis]